MKYLKAIAWIFLIIPIFFLWSCDGGSSGSDGLPSNSGDTGTLSLNMVDAPGGSYQAVYVTIKEVRVCMETGFIDGEGEDCDCNCQWETIATLNQTYNLLELVNGVMATLGLVELEAGTYNQMRLLLHDQPDDTLNLLDQSHPYPQYLIDEDGEAHEMKVPSGYQSGIKLVHQFEIVSDLTTELILDFDVARSVVKAGNSGKYLLKPTIKVIGTNNRTAVSGLVTSDDDTPVPLEGAQVSAWHQDLEGNWSVAMSTVTDATGAYMLYLDIAGVDPEEYKIVAAADGYEPACTILMVEADQNYPDTNFALSPTQMVTVSGTIIGAAPSSEGDSFPAEAPVVTVSFSRQDGDCFLDPVETAFVQATDDEDDQTTDVFYNSEDGTFQYVYSIEIAAGIYDVTASSEGLVPEEVEGFVAAVPDAELNFDFSD